MDSLAAAPLADTFEMMMVHRVFRREFRRDPEPTRAVAAGDRRRARIVGATLSDIRGRPTCEPTSRAR